MQQQRRYSYSVEPTDTSPGWRLGNRVVPTRFMIHIKRYKRHAPDGSTWAYLSDAEVDALFDPVTPADRKTIALEVWLELEVVSSATEPPRCVMLHAPDGISTPEQRFPLAGIVATAAATIASKDGSFVDHPLFDEYEDALSEAKRARGPKRRRTAVTPDRLDEVAQISDAHPVNKTAAVQRQLGISRGYAFRLRKLAEARANENG